MDSSTDGYLRKYSDYMEALAFRARPGSLKAQIINLMKIGILWVLDKGFARNARRLFVC